MAGYSKLFDSIITSSIWCEDSDILRIWIAMIATADADGIVEGSVPGFANLARVSIEKMEEAIVKFSAPDPYSRTPDFEGRRIERIHGGWRLLNYAAHRERGQGQEGSRAPYMRIYRRQQREAESARVTDSCNESERVTISGGSAASPYASSGSEIQGRGGMGEKGDEVDEIDPHAFTQELVAEINAHGHDLKPHPGITVAVTNLLEAGHPKGLMYVNGAPKLTREDLLDAAHGWIVAEAKDRWHREQRDRGSPFTFARLLTEGSRLAEYAERGRSGWATWRAPAAVADPLPAQAPDPEILARHQKREAERLAAEKAKREEKPPKGLSARETRDWYEKRGRKTWEGRA